MEATILDIIERVGTVTLRGEPTPEEIVRTVKSRFVEALRRVDRLLRKRYGDVEYVLKVVFTRPEEVKMREEDLIPFEPVYSKYSYSLTLSSFFVKGEDEESPVKPGTKFRIFLIARTPEGDILIPIGKLWNKILSSIEKTVGQDMLVDSIILAESVLRGLFIVSDRDIEKIGKLILKILLQSKYDEKDVAQWVRKFDRGVAVVYSPLLRADQVLSLPKFDQAVVAVKRGDKFEIVNVSPVNVAYFIIRHASDLDLDEHLVGDTVTWFLALHGSSVFTENVREALPYALTISSWILQNVRELLGDEAERIVKKWSEQLSREVSSRREVEEVIRELESSLLKVFEKYRPKIEEALIVSGSEKELGRVLRSFVEKMFDEAINDVCSRLGSKALNVKVILVRRAAHSNEHPVLHKVGSIMIRARTKDGSEEFASLSSCVFEYALCDVKDVAMTKWYGGYILALARDEHGSYMIVPVFRPLVTLLKKICEIIDRYRSGLNKSKILRRVLKSLLDLASSSIADTTLCRLYVVPLLYVSTDRLDLMSGISPRLSYEYCSNPLFVYDGLFDMSLTLHLTDEKGKSKFITSEGALAAALASCLSRLGFILEKDVNYGIVSNSPSMIREIAKMRGWTLREAAERLIAYYMLEHPEKARVGLMDKVALEAKKLIEGKKTKSTRQSILMTV